MYKNNIFIKVQACSIKKKKEDEYVPFIESNLFIILTNGIQLLNTIHVGKKLPPCLIGPISPYRNMKKKIVRPIFVLRCDRSEGSYGRSDARSSHQE